MEKGVRCRKEDLLRSLPGEWPHDLRAEIRERVRASGRKVVVLDDDPTGSQTVHGIPVLTEWSVESIGAELENELPAFFILTNSRSLSPTRARSLNAEIGRNLVNAARRTGREYVVVSRSDSTLRGHFPGEVEALAQSLGPDVRAWIVLPFFLEGGRYTIEDIHYVDEKGWLVPAGETEFARDTVFGYRSSNLRDWVEEKTEGRISSGDVSSITIEDLRRGGPDRIAQCLTRSGKAGCCIVNAASYRDLEVFVRGLLESEAHGTRYLYRTAASFVQVRAGILPRPLLSCSDLQMDSSGGGLVIVGSHVPRTTGQLRALLEVKDLFALELNVDAVLDPGLRGPELVRVARAVDAALERSQDTVVYTSRDLRTADNPEADLGIGQRVSEALTELLTMISSPPRYLIAKGGITASDVATAGLNVKRAMVLGQILPGVPVWALGPESRYPRVPYVVFPGNVGGPEALAQAVRMLRKD